MEKTCHKCKNSKPLTEFYNNKKTLYGVTTNCKECIKSSQQKRLKSKRDGYHRVYLLTERNYAGTTQDIYQRMNRHKTDGNITNSKNYRVLYKTKNRDEALELESLLHDIGYEGRHSKNSYV